MMQSGRPLWKNYEIFFKSFEIAKIKLTGDKRLRELTSLIMRTGSSIVPQDELARKLVLSGMATLLYVDASNSRCWAEYIPEPMFSNASRVVLTEIVPLTKAIKEYVRRFQLGTFHDSGNAGELVARIVLLRAFDLAVLKFQPGIAESRYLSPLFSDKLFGTDKTFEPGIINLAKVQEFPITETNVTIAAEEDIKINEFMKISLHTPKVGITTLKKYMRVLSGMTEELDDFSRFGVSEAVLNGLVSVNQFIRAEKSLSTGEFEINQKYLLHCFSRSCALILPAGMKGLDLVIPILRSDNKMSCIAIQIENFKTTIFPDRTREIMDKLTTSYLDYLNFKAIGEIDAAPEDDFIRIVIQFSDILDGRIGFEWLGINEQLSEDPSAEKQSKHALWLLGMKLFHPIFFNNQEILMRLEYILSGQRNFIDVIDFPRVKLPTKLQTTREGVEFLISCARSLSYFDKTFVNDATIRPNSIENNHHAQPLDKFMIPRFALEHKKHTSIVINPTSPQVFDIIVESEDNKSEKRISILGDVVLENFSYNGI